MRVGVLNPGSSTLKASVVLVETGADLAVESETTIEWPSAEGADAVVRRALGQLGAAPEAVGYRVVHGGREYRAPTRVDNQLIEAIERLDVLARLHNRRAAAVIRTCLVALPDLPHVACFDTAFHATLPEEAWRYPLPAAWIERFGIRRYGFHGLSVEWAARRAADLLRRPPDELGLVVAHLGSGCSVTAVQGGMSVDTSMGFTPLEGLMMGTRAGSVDPGILLHLQSQGMGPDELAAGLAERSGLLAVASSYDVRLLEQRSRAGDPEARLALQMFARRAAAAIAAAATSLERLDGLVFTGGIGEHAATVRHDVLTRLSVLGLPPPPGEPLTAPDGVLHSGPPAVVVVAAREELVIGETVAALVRDKPPANP